MQALRFTLPLLLTTCSAFAQSNMPATADTAGHKHGFDVYYLGDLNRTNGTEERAYLPARHLGYERILYYYYSPPGQKGSKREQLKMDGVRSMTVHGRYFEKLIINSEATDILALRMVQGPMELFGYAQPKAVPLPIPVPGGAMVSTVLVDGYTKQRWFVRQQGSVVPISKGKFAVQMSALLSNYPALARQVSAGEEGYRYENIQAIVREYNDYLNKLSR